MILDTNAVSALLTGEPGLDEVLGVADRHHLPVIVIGEYRFGLLGLRQRPRLESLFLRLIAESIVLDVEHQTAEHYAAIRHELRQQGQPVPENDLWIAALARQYDLEIVSRDPHFDVIAGVKRVAW